MSNLKEITFANCNLFNLQLPGKSMYGGSKWTQEQYDKKIKWTSNIVQSLDADVIGFQELWHADALTEVFKKAGLLNDYTLMTQEATGSKIVCAAAVRKSLSPNTPEWMTDFPDKFILKSKGDDPQTRDIQINIDSYSRPVLRFSIEPRNNHKINVCVCHFKSKAPSKIYKNQWYIEDKDYYSKHSEGIGSALSTIRRTAEAAALRMTLIDELKGTDTAMVVLGDLNDSQLSNTLNVLSGQPTYLSVLSKGGGDADLYSVATLQEYRSLRDVFYTHIHQNIKESLDHILVSQEFYDNSKKRIWAFAGMDIMNDHLNNEEHKEDGSSDHGIVKATFKYKPAN
ncbi:endonuclease/exonuclease/phosphatase family protein [Carboxylicivirga sp. N1Y90]|uniref:endonuclease/exonuclease/phosphatase family protein n=1 Tax=Carboxylicivirga fragile TaxID=3417571 RepID=UPI003D32FFAC|nr:hypothetical protein [Marinilabiliaceae bacterium N1Y90]